MTNLDTQAAATQAAYYYQNLFAARESLDLLDVTTGVERVTVEMEGAPHIDDVVVVRRGAVVFHQVKYAGSAPADALTNADLLALGPRGRSLWQKLVRGWIAVRTIHDDVQVHLVTNRPLSEQPSTVGSRALPALQGIVGRLLTPCRESVAAGVPFEPPPDLADTWHALQEAAGLTTDFDKFVSVFRIVPEAGSLAAISAEIHRTLQRLTGTTGEARLCSTP